jgi:pyruvate dehydrogenase kinase 2/3/4
MTRIRTFSWDFVKSKSIPCRYILNHRMEADWIVEELPVRLAHRVKDLDHLPDKLHEMPSIQKVKNWYAQSFEVHSLFTLPDVQELTTFPKPSLSSEVKELLVKAAGNGNGNSNGNSAYPAKHNPSLKGDQNRKPTQNLRKAQVTEARYPCLPTMLTGRYYGRVDDFTWPPEVRAYNNNFTKALSVIKRRHDPVVTTMGIPMINPSKD